VFFERGAGVDRLRNQPVIEHVTCNRAAGHAFAVCRAYRDAARPGQDHAVNRIALREQRRDLQVPLQHRQDAGIHRVAAQLVTWKSRAIE
jgi:hypothetical protein